MSYSPQHHLTTEERCPERIRMRVSPEERNGVSSPCLGTRYHPQPHWAMIESTGTGRLAGGPRRVEWYLPPTVAR